MKRLLISFVMFAAGTLATPAADQPSLELKKGDHIALIGNALPDRMQFDGYLETLITAAYPDLDLSFRNLAATGDEVATRARSENFGTPDQWLDKTKSDVVLAYFGFNESFAGEEGLDKFKTDLGNFLKQTKAMNYSGKGSPRIVLFSPIAAEHHQDPNFALPDKINGNVQLYTRAMSEVARENGVPFVDLYAPTKSLFDYNRDQKRSLTIDGLHLSQEGDEVLAPIMFRALFGKEPPQGDFSKLRQAINGKNWQWHMRYRTIDGYNVYGGRSALAYQPEKGSFISDRDPPDPYISNYEVMQREMEMRDVMVANRDQRVWAVARGGDLKVDDSNLPPPIEVPTNERGSNPDGTFPVTGGEEMISQMKVHANMKVNLFASEEQFPELISPLQMAWDTKGRLWVAVWRNYPERKPTSTIGDSLLIFEDTDGDGKADKVTHFLDDLNAPTGFQFYKDGVLVMQAPDLWFVRDTDGDDHADTRERVLMGMDSADSHHTANSLSYDPGGSIYLSDGVFHRTQVETANGPVRNLDACIYRFEPRTRKFERFISYGFANPHGKVFDRWGNGIMTDATGNNSYFAAAFSGHIDYPMKHPGMQQFWDRPSRPCAGTGMISSRHFPEEFQGNFMNCNVIGFQGIYLVKVTEDGSGIKGETIEPLVSSTNYNFRPSNVDIGPDGAVYFLDWEKPLIGHMQHHLRDPNRFFPHGRIYRVTYDGRPLLKQPKIDGQPIPALLELLKSPEDGVRQLAKIELGKHDSQEVVSAVQHWITTLDKSSPDYEHEMMEALWVHQWHNIVNVELLKRMLNSPEPRAVAAAARVLCYWRDRVPGALDLFRQVAEDAHPRVRLEAVRAASFFDEPPAVDVVLAILKQPTDYYLDYTLKETMRQLEPVWHKALSEGKSIAADNPKGVEYILGSVPNSGLANLPRIEGVLEAYLTRPGIADADRAVALADLADKRGRDRATLLLDLIKNEYGNKADAQKNLARMLPTIPADELKDKRTEVAALTGANGPGVVKPAAWAALAAADGSFDSVFSQAKQSPSSLAELLAGIPLLMDPSLRSAAWSQVRPLLTSVPSGWDSGELKGGSMGRYVRIELPRRGTLTLAEVEVMSDGRNIARFGKASQSSVANGGSPDRAIDGRTDGDYASGTQTHTRENSRNPWWEVDLGATRPVNSVVIWNRTEGELKKRLDHFTLRVLDDSRNVVFEQKDNPAPDKNVTIAVSTDPVGTMRRAAIQALASMGTRPEETFGALSDLVVKGEEVVEATRALRSVPRASWSAKDAGAAARALVAWAKSVPTDARTSQDFVETTQTASDLTGLLPASEAVALRSELKDIRVAVFVVRTVREQMRYDTPRIVVEAGKPFEIIIVNDDFMPHNMVVTMPDGREVIGPMADKMQPDKLDPQGRAFIPSSVTNLSRPNELIIDATRLIEPGQQATLKLTAPDKEGDYTYVCTFPGHWPVMWGTLVVTKDVDAYLQAHPVAAPAGGGHQGHGAFE